MKSQIIPRDIQEHLIYTKISLDKAQKRRGRVYVKNKEIRVNNAEILPGPNSMRCKVLSYLQNFPF